MSFPRPLFRCLRGLVLLAFLAAPCRAAEPELRGMWVNSWGRGLRSPAEITNMVSAAKRGRLNALFVQVRRRGDALYESQVVPKSDVVPPGFDPLSETLRQARAAGLEVHAWLPLMPAWSGRAGLAPPPGHILRRHPEWATASKSGKRMALSDGAEGVYLDPGIPGVRAEMVAVVEDIVKGYPELDGIHLDYVRYPATEWGYNPQAVARFKAETGHTPTGNPAAFDAWRREQVTRLVEQIADSMKRIAPEMRLSAAVYADRADAYSHRFQDWGAWMRDGLVDFVCPMNYATAHATFDRRAKEALNRPGAPAYIGVGAWNKPVASALRQAKSARAMGAGGLLFYDYANTRPEFWAALAKDVFTVPSATPWAKVGSAGGR